MKEHIFAMDLTPNGRMSSVLMDGEDISGLLQGIVVSSSANGRTVVELQPAPGAAIVQLIARLPEAQIVILKRDDDDTRETLPSV